MASHLDLTPEEIESFSGKVLDVVISQEASTANELRRRGWRILGDLFVKIAKISIKNHFMPVVSAWVRDYTSNGTTDSFEINFFFI